MDKFQFDEHLGGNITLSHDVAMKKLISARASEISAMTHSVENPRQTKLLFQKLPVHMRRRVMSHNAKRMPRRLREAHTKQMEKSGLPPKVKRPSRKYRRRTKNLLAFTYNRRKLSRGWLETHIWHAKRFHMCNKWGYKIANFSNDRNFRATYRAISKYCTIQDISYYSCIELIGPEDVLIERLNIHARSELSFGARIYSNGLREGNLVFYSNNGSPIGSINFHWQPVTETMKRAIWIWVHPAIFDEILDQLLSTFNFIEVQTKATDQHHQLAKNDNKLYTTEDSECSMELLRSAFNRFRIRGPLSIAVTTDTLKLPASLSNDNNDPLDSLSNSWLGPWCENPINRESFKVQSNVYDTMKQLNSPGQFPRNSILAITVIDPRMFLPQVKTKTVSNMDNGGIFIPKLPDYASNSPLWDQRVRSIIKTHCKPTKNLKPFRCNNLVPGVQNDLEIDKPNVEKVPVLLIQYPGSDCGGKSISFSSGLDIIVPAGWALSFWIALTYRCARPIGLAEYQSMTLENLVLNSPEINHPDTCAYSRAAVETKNQLVSKYCKLPPNKRINYAKFSISSPFLCQWSILMKEWTNRDQFRVLRDRTRLNQLNSILNNFTHKDMSQECLTDASIINSLFSHDDCFLIPVRVTMIGKGRPKQFSLICIPTMSDLKTSNAPVETIKSDALKTKRELTRVQHKESLKRLKMKNSKKVGDNQVMENLYLPECKKVRNSCDREVMGYIVQGDFSFAQSSGIGWGYIALQSLFQLIQQGTNKIVVRNVQSRQYRWATLDIII